MRKAKRKFTVDKKVRRKYPLFAFLAVLLLLAAGAFFLLRDTDDSKKSQSTNQTNDQQSDAPQPATDSKTPTPTPSSDSGDPKDQTTPTPSGSAPTTPFGSFVSNHQPELESAWELNRMQSVCNTSPGASCKISFTKGGETKSLSAQKADKEGAAYWSWTLQEIGLTEGVWKITATATLNGQTSSASDPINLEVKQ
jgi:hypothetical protein